ncbi:MAG: S8 family serine peptidase, partial [Candidatus Cloacimonetes bacterium]|nr:S8 family serine peptidase [Candidatus Cloacimonadota bacterium]
MKKLICIIILSFFSVIILQAQVVSNNEVIVRFSQKAETKNSLTGISSFDNVISRYNVQKITPVLENKGFYIYHILCEKKLDFEELKNLVNIKSEIIYVQPNYINKMLSVTPNDPKYYKQWGLEAIRANKAWDIEKGNEQVVIGLIDSGVDYNHPDLANNIWINPDEIPDNGIDDDNNGFIDDWQGWDFTDTEMLEALGDCRERDNDPMDDLGHGTHCAGIISAQTNNNLGVAGVTWFCKLMNIRAGFRTTAGGFLEDDDVSSAIIYAADNGAQIISISWGDTELSPVIRDVCQYAFEMGVVIIASAGNEAGVGLLYPAALDNIISVTAVDEDLSLCSFSSYGEGIDLCAPGLNITSTYLNNDYKEEGGTSMSAPFVSGAVALLLSQNPLLTNDEIYNLLKISCDDLGEKGYDNQFGYGIINIEKLLINSTKSNQIEAEISSPKYNDGFHQNFPIIGNAYCPEFFHYSVTFTDKPNPEENDWLDIVTHNPTPYYYDTLVFDDTLAFFNTEGIADSTYYLRLSVKDINGNNFVDIIKVNIDKSPPEFIENTTSINTRYNFDKKNYYILSVTDEPVKFKATCFSSEVDSFLIIESKFSRVASLRLPENLPDTQLSFFIDITNKSGLSNSTEIFYDTINIDNSSIATSGFEKLFEYPNAGYLCPNNYDINNNGKKELVFMEFPEEGTYGQVKFCEENNNNDLIVKYTMPVEFQPWSIGDSNGDGKFEIVGNIGDSILIYEATSEDTFPNSFIFGKRGIGGLYGCAFQDLNGNGSDELLVNTILDSQKTAYRIYNREVNNAFVYSGHWLLNNTHTYSKNQLSPHIQFGYLDNDGLLDILLSDIDGDILIYEAKNLNSLNFEVKDTLYIPIPNALYLSIGDLDGDGTDEFIVGGYNEDIMNPNNQVWLYAVFGAIENDQYAMIDYTEISGVSSKNGLCIADLDPDKHNGDEVIIAASPDIYIYKLQNNEFKPIWVGNSYRSYYPISLDLDNDNVNESVAFNQKNGQDSLCLVLYHYPDNIIDVPIPQNFTAIPINKNSIRLNWRSISDIDSFKIYRTSSFDSISFSLDDTIDTFIDTSVFADTFYFYQASAIKNGIESYKTLKKLAVPT